MEKKIDMRKEGKMSMVRWHGKASDMSEAVIDCCYRVPAKGGRMGGWDAKKIVLVNLSIIFPNIFF